MQIRVLLGVVLFFWTIARLIFAPFFVIDADYNAREAMKASFLLTSGKTFKTVRQGLPHYDDLDRRALQRSATASQSTNNSLRAHRLAQLLNVQRRK